MAITIKHLEGPLAGTKPQRFGDDVQEIMFGRAREADVLYPMAYDVVGRKHFQLQRDRAGGYAAELLGKHFVAIDGVQADNLTPVKSGSVFRLGRMDGPSFQVEIELPAAEGVVTGVQGKMQTPGERERDLRRRVTYAFGAVAATLLALGSYVLYLHSTFEHQIADATEEWQKQAKDQIPGDMVKTMMQAVYLVVKDDGSGPTPAATAWAFAPEKLATNAHVTEAIRAHPDMFYLLGPNGGEKIKIKDAKSHPGYLAFNGFKSTAGTESYHHFTALDLPSTYDVGIIEIDSAKPLPAMLQLAPSDYVRNLKVGTEVASAGFPSEGLVGASSLARDPDALLHYGYISSLKDIFLCRTDPGHSLLVLHSVPVTGGASGSPVIDKSGKVIAIVSGGNTVDLHDPTASVTDQARAPNAALVNFGQRIDLLEDLDAGRADAALAQDEANYWKEAAGHFVKFFDFTLNRFEQDAAQRYGVDPAGGEHTVLDKDGSLEPDPKSSDYVFQHHEIEAQPGFVYGFIGDAESGVPIIISVKKDGAFFRDAKDPRKSFEPDPAPTAWATVPKPTTLDVVVWGQIAQPAKYVLHEYRWKLPGADETRSSEASPAPANSTPPAQDR